MTVQAALTLARTDKSIMSKNMKKTEAILREMVMITLRSELTKIQRTNLETCITIHMHQKESTGILVHFYFNHEEFYNARKWPLTTCGRFSVHFQG